MTEQKGDDTTAEPPGHDPALDGEELPGLMAADAEAAAPQARPSGSDVGDDVGDYVEADALRAAEQALAEGHRALADARQRLAGERGRAAPGRTPRSRRSRELLLRSLLILNVLAMIGVATIPGPLTTQVANQPKVSAPVSGDPRTSEPKFNEPWNQALAAAEQGDFALAVTILDRYLEGSPRMAPSQQLSVLMALAHYSARQNDFEGAQRYQRRADAIERSHSLPEDLVAMAKAAAADGDQEALRRIWARFLLQQRQVPNWLYKHVAEAWLQLGDSYRQEANAASEEARLRELEETAEALRTQSAGREGGK